MAHLTVPKMRIASSFLTLDPLCVARVQGLVGLPCFITSVIQMTTEVF